jgi:hypothetical protein
MPREFDDLKDGTELEPFHLNIIYRELRRLRKMTASPPLVLEGMESSVSAPLLRGSQIPRAGLGQANGDITARSGTTPGAGTVDIWQNNAGTLEATGDTVDVANVGIAITDGKFVWWQENDDDGETYVAPLECS